MEVVITGWHICTALGWIFLITSWLWRNKTDEDKEITIKLMFSTASASFFIANLIYWFFG